MGKKGKNDKKNVNWDEVREFISLVYETADDYPVPSGFEVFFSITEEGFVGLNGELAARYRQCLHNLILSVQADQISNKVIGQHFQKALLFTLDIHERRRDQSFEARLDSAIQELQKALRAKPIIFRVYYPVENLANTGLPLKYGNVQFRVFDTELKSDLLSQMSQLLTEPNQNLTDHFEAILGKLSERVVGVIDIPALEPEAAAILAQKRIQLALDTINYFSSLLNWHSWTYLPGNGEYAVVGYAIRKVNEVGASIGNSRVGPAGPLSLDKLHENDDQYKLGLSTVSRILALEKGRGKFQDSLLGAVRWAGKAAVSGRTEESFLSYAIALESLILADNEREELQYRLITRIAHLIGPDLASRKKLSNTMKNLYRLRSQIVHSGEADVTDVDLAKMRFITEQCICRVLKDPTFSEIKTIQDWADWFNDRILDTVA